MEWISVKDRLPHDDDVVILFSHDYGLFTLGFYMSEKRVMSQGFWRIDDSDTAQKLDFVTHWMPLPQPPNLDE